MKAAVYLRQSQDKNDDRLAVTRQREDCLRLCEQRGWTPVEYEDNDFSASVRMPGSTRTAKPRPAYQRMLRDISNGAIGAIIAWDTDRLVRHPRELEDIIDLADRQRLELATVGGDFALGTPTGRGNARMKGVFARMEMEQKSERQKRSATQLAESGRPWWPSRPFGFRFSLGVPVLDRDGNPELDKHGKPKLNPPPQPVLDADRRPMLDAGEAELIADAYRAVKAGKALHAIAADWNERGVTTPKGCRWRGAQVRQVLLNARNAGLRTLRGEVVTDKKGKPIEAGWPAIVTEDVFQDVYNILTDPARRSGPTRGRKRLLSGIALCGVCELPLGSGITSTTGQPNYLCQRCFKVSRSAAKVDEMVVEAVIERLSREDAADLMNDDRPDLDGLSEQRASLRRQQKALGVKHAKGEVSLTMAAAADAEFTEQIEALTKQMTNANHAEIFEGVIGADDVFAAFDGLDLGRQRTIVDALFTITVKPTGRGRTFRPESVLVAPRR